MLWGLVAFWVSLALAPLSVFSQGTAPVTVQVLFPCESNCGGVLPGLNAASILGDELMSQVVLLQRPRTLGGIFRYEHIHWQQGGRDVDANSYATSLQLTWDRDRVSFGALLPYDFLDFERFQEHIVGLVPFVQYRLPLSASSTVAFTANGNYAHTANNGGLGDWDTYGGGVSLSATRDEDFLVVRGGLSYQYNYNHDGTENSNYHQHLLKFGADVGGRIGSAAIVSLFGVWNYDPTDYKGVVITSQQNLTSQNNYVDLGLNVDVNLSTTWKLTGGYKTVLGLRHFTSHQVFLGSLFRF